MHNARAFRAVVFGCFVSASGGLGLALGGCARDPAQQRLQARFDAARDQCGTTVAETAEVQRCMRAHGWSYRLPWQ